MSVDPKLADRLSAMRDMNRPFHFFFEGSLLRRGETRTARARTRRRRAELRPQMEAELRERGRRAFRDPVSVSIALFGRRTNAPASVKAYLDCMEGIFYADDRAVEHLYVQAFSGVGEGEEERVSIEIEPLTMYATNFDHAYLRLGGAFGKELDLDLVEDLERDDLDELERELSWERRHGRHLFDVIAPELAEERRAEDSRRIGQLRFRTLVAKHLYPHDRPGSDVLGPSPDP